MTARKGFKKLVRDRMERTGETYSTASRHVAGPYTAANGTHHESALAKHLLDAAGLPLSEAMICGLGGGIGFMYAVFEYATVPHPLLTIVAQHHPQPWAPAVLDRLGVPYEQLHSASAKTALGKLDKALAQGGLALCSVDRALLPWHSPSQFSAAEPYTVVVSAGTGGTVVIQDPPHGRHELDLADFAAAWTSHRQGRHHLLRITGDAITTDMAAATRDAMAITVAHLTGPVLGNSFDVNFGFSGMAKLAGELRDTRSRKGWARRFADPVGHAHAMRRLVECLEQQYTAPSATRPLYADFLDEADPRLAEAAELMRTSGRTWSRLAARAAEATPAEAGMRAWCDQAADLVDECLAAERAAVALITRAR